MDARIEIRIFALNHNLRQMAYAEHEMTRDAFTDVGLEYETNYEENAWFRAKIAEYENLNKVRKYTLFTYIYNFTQCYYGLKEYLAKLIPREKHSIEDFFSNISTQYGIRKQIANDLKHKPSKDLDFDWRRVAKATIRKKGIIQHTSHYNNTWFYGDKEAVEHCKRMYDDLVGFLENLEHT